MKKLRIVDTGRSYSPESYAYERYFRAHGWIVERAAAAECEEVVDVEIRMLGLDPIWHGRRTARTLVHEYHSLSTGTGAKLKNLGKRLLNRQPDGRIFLDETVRLGYSFSDEIPFLLRPMGIDQEFFDVKQGAKLYDFVYCGSLHRVGLIQVISKIILMNFRVLLIGHIPSDVQAAFAESELVDFAGPQARDKIPELLAAARFGLNYVPDEYPLNIQTSTKVLEYVAAGLPVISNRYRWIEDFSKLAGFPVMWLDDVSEHTCNTLRPVDRRLLCDLEWESMLNRIDLEGFVLGL
jgi:glycosyltransferase involved in cell wall biosynthesis